MRVIVADDQIEVRSAIKLLMEEKTGLEVVGEAAEGAALLKLVEAVRPDLVVLDWELGEARPGAALDDLQALQPDLPVIVLSSRPQVQAAALEAGARAFVCKSDPPESLIRAVESI